MLLHDDPDNVDHSHQHQQNLLLFLSLLPSQSRLPLCCFGPFIIKCCAAAQINSLFSYTNETFLPSDITLTPTLAAVFFIAVVHAVQHVVAAPAPRDAVGPIQTQELVFSALLHTADLLAKTQAQPAGVLINTKTGQREQHCRTMKVYVTAAMRAQKMLNVFSSGAFLSRGPRPNICTTLHRIISLSTCSSMSATNPQGWAGKRSRVCHKVMRAFMPSGCRLHSNTDGHIKGFNHFTPEQRSKRVKHRNTVLVSLCCLTHKDTIHSFSLLICLFSSSWPQTGKLYSSNLKTESNDLKIMLLQQYNMCFVF